MGDAFIDSYLQARTMRAMEDLADRETAGEREAAKAYKELNDLTEKWNKLVVDSELLTKNLGTQRDEALRIFAENEASLPFTAEEARQRIREAGFKAESELAKSRFDMDISPIPD